MGPVLVYGEFGAAMARENFFYDYGDGQVDFGFTNYGLWPVPELSLPASLASFSTPSTTIWISVGRSCLALEGAPTIGLPKAPLL